MSASSYKNVTQACIYSCSVVIRYQSLRNCRTVTERLFMMLYSSAVIILANVLTFLTLSVTGNHGNSTIDNCNLITSQQMCSSCDCEFCYQNNTTGNCECGMNASDIFNTTVQCGDNGDLSNQNSVTVGLVTTALIVVVAATVLLTLYFRRKYKKRRDNKETHAGDTRKRSAVNHADSVHRDMVDIRGHQAYSYATVLSIEGSQDAPGRRQSGDAARNIHTYAVINKPRQMHEYTVVEPMVQENDHDSFADYSLLRAPKGVSPKWSSQKSEIDSRGQRNVGDVRNPTRANINGATDQTDYSVIDRSGRRYRDDNKEQTNVYEDLQPIITNKTGEPSSVPAKKNNTSTDDNIYNEVDRSGKKYRPQNEEQENLVQYSALGEQHKSGQYNDIDFKGNIKPTNKPPKRQIPSDASYMGVAEVTSPKTPTAEAEYSLLDHGLNVNQNTREKRPRLGDEYQHL
ncbi:uncharacterized protein LOC144449920 isoform X2 [Glandiceps talaboti]